MTQRLEAKREQRWAVDEYVSGKWITPIEYVSGKWINLITYPTQGLAESAAHYLLDHGRQVRVHPTRNGGPTALLKEVK